MAHTISDIGRAHVFGAEHPDPLLRKQCAFWARSEVCTFSMSGAAKARMPSTSLGSVLMWWQLTPQRWRYRMHPALGLSALLALLTVAETLKPCRSGQFYST